MAVVTNDTFLDFVAAQFDMNCGLMFDLFFFKATFFIAQKLKVD